MASRPPVPARRRTGDIAAGLAELAEDAEWVERRDCLALLRIILAILQRGDPADIPTLRTAVKAHSQLYKKFYHAIPKLHEILASASTVHV